MHPKRYIALAATFVAAALIITIWQSPEKAASPDSATKERLAEARVEVAGVEAAYPPALPSYYEPLPKAPADTTELCGYGKVAPGQIPALIAVADTTLVRVVDELVRAPDPRKRALGLATQASINATAADQRSMAEDPQNCATWFCEERAAEASARAATPSIEALAKLAINTQDPQVYVMAMRACRSIITDSPPSICSSLTLDQWAQVDPDNAMVWLLQARAARMRKDMIGFEDALQRAARAKFFDRRPTPYGEILASVDEPWQRTLVVGRLTAADSRHDPGEFLSNFTVFNLHCAKQSEPGRRELCNDLAHVLLELSSDGLAYQVGEALAFHAGWPHERTFETRKHMDLQDGPWVRGVQDVPLSCDGSAGFEQRLLLIARRR